MDGQEIPPSDAQGGYSTGSFPPPVICGCFPDQRELGQKEPCSFPGSQVLGLLRAPGCCIFGSVDPRIGFRREKDQPLKLAIPAVKAGLPATISIPPGALRRHASHNPRANCSAAPLRAGCLRHAGCEREPGVLTAAHAPGRCSSTLL